MAANTFLLSFFFAALQISAAQAMQTAADASAMPSVSHNQDIQIGFSYNHFLTNCFDIS